jgi:hypothetical protein
LGSELETFAVRIFAQADDHFLDEVFEAGAGESRQFCCGFHKVNFAIGVIE